MRAVSPLNNDWQYLPEFKDEFITSSATSEWNAVELPHTNVELPLTYFDEKDFQFVSTYKRTLDLSQADRSQLAYLHFEGVMTSAEVYLNGQHLGGHKGGYTGFDILLNPALRYDGTDELTVVVDSTERADIPPFGGQIDYLTYGGIYREVQLKLVNKKHIHNIFAKPADCLQDKKRLDVDVHLNNQTGEKGYEVVTVSLVDGDQVLASQQLNCQLSGQKEDCFTFEFTELENIELWDMDTPKLYTVQVSTEHDSDSHRTGFREAKFTTDGFFLNGRHVQIIGLNRHQSFPYVGYAMPARVQRQDADILKNELGLNTVRTSHYPQSRHFLDRCDEIGLLVFEEIPGWQHIGDKEWQAVAVENVREMIKRDWNRPSIILWGVRINESADNHDFYAETNAVARELDPTRQTGGVRCFEGSEFLEDVYTMNDFALDGVRQTTLGQRIALRGQQDITKLEQKVPYMVTEYNGHMFPTKKQDPEEHQQEHSLRHLLVVDAGCADKEVSGTIGWCAFDYNTHKDFGSGDRICHHGVMDMFRLPKFAAYAYRSQKSPEVEPVLKPATLWTRGDRADGMEVSPMLVMTNCDKVEVFIGDKLYGTFLPSRAHFKGLEYPPIVIPKIEGEWGMSWAGAEFVGYHKGEEVIRKVFTEAPVFDQLALEADDSELALGETWDSTRMVVSALDQAGNPLMFHNTIVNIEVSGAVDLIGPKQIMLQGGSTAFWVRTTGEEGPADISITSPEGKTNKLTLNVL